MRVAIGLGAAGLLGALGMAAAGAAAGAKGRAAVSGPAGKAATGKPRPLTSLEPALDPGEKESVAGPGMPRPMELVALATKRLRVNGRIVLDVWRGALGKPRDGTHWKIVALGKFGLGYDVVKLYAREPRIFEGSGVVYHHDRLKATSEFFTFWPGAEGLKRLTAEDRGKIRKGTGVTSGVYGGYPAEHVTLGLEVCKLGPCWHVRSWPKEKEKHPGAVWDVYVLQANHMVANAERFDDGGKSLWRYELERFEVVDGRATERIVHLYEERDGKETLIEIGEVGWDLVFEGNFFDAKAFVDGGWKKRK